ncbi:hypothetical protein JXA40_09805 [bacterium]|nr:hypothetical protein [candidate division CSSED10-310 bacterium]
MVFRRGDNGSRFKIEPRDNNDISATLGTPAAIPTSIAPIPATGPVGLGVLIFVLSGLIGFGTLKKAN